MCVPLRRIYVSPKGDYCLGVTHPNRSHSRCIEREGAIIKNIYKHRFGTLSCQATLCGSSAYGGAQNLLHLPTEDFFVEGFFLPLLWTHDSSVPFYISFVKLFFVELFSNRFENRISYFCILFEELSCCIVSTTKFYLSK